MVEGINLNEVLTVALGTLLSASVPQLPGMREV